MNAIVLPAATSKWPVDTATTCTTLPAASDTSLAARALIFTDAVMPSEAPLSTTMTPSAADSTLVAITFPDAASTDIEPSTTIPDATGMAADASDTLPP